MRSYNQVAACVCALTSAAAAVLVEAPTAENFVRRSMAKAAVLGNYLYIDGGLVTQLEDGELRGRGQNQANTTLSIDLSTSWTSKDVTFRSIPKTAPIKANQVLWADPAFNNGNGAFYTFGGQSWLGENMTDTEVWKFTADGKGGGSWSKVTASNPVVLNGIKQTEHATVAFTNDTGFAIGGAATGWTEKNRQSTQSMPGMMSFNFRTSSFSNGTEAPFEGLIGGQARYVDSFGPNGLVMVLGGVTIPVEKYTSVSEASGVDFIEQTFFDPITKEVFKQKTTGEIPPAPRVDFCNVGFETADGGYDIFIFGGGNERDKITYDDAYVLSLPGFVWHKLPNSPAGTRLQHACVAVGGRQVLVVGGTTGSGMKIPDPAPQGLHLFDMASWSWRYGFEANDGGYESGKAIRDWYGNGSLEKVKWTSERVKKLFVVGEDGAASATEGADGSAPTGGSGDESSLDPVPGKTPIGAIVGGVLGGIALLLIIAVVVFVLIRKKRRERAATELGGSELPPSYRDAPRVTGPAYLVEAPCMDGGKYMYASEVYAGPQVPEATGGEKSDRHEAGVEHGYVEMYSAGGKGQGVSVEVAPIELDAGSVRDLKK